MATETRGFIVHGGAEPFGFAQHPRRVAPASSDIRFTDGAGRRGSRGRRHLSRRSKTWHTIA
ncbi:hypothetical protein A33M_2011 [Rhodovulum sp. PH10]|nr:hypothetical protein A33M_2011 [Rhodovulum sp. PH10]